MPELLIAPNPPVVESGSFVDVVVTVDTTVWELIFRDADTQGVVFNLKRAEPFSGWDVSVSGPLSKALLSSDDATATFRITSAASAETTVPITFSAIGALSGPVQLQVTVQVTNIDDAIPLSGNVSGTLATGTIHRIVGDVTLTGDLVVEGILVGDDTFELDGGGFQILVQNGGQMILEGIEKTAWAHWGDAVVGWQVGDRLAVAPTAVGVFTASETVWGGSWGATTRPANSPDVVLIDASTARPEVINLSQSILLHNLRRIHFHNGAGVQTFKWLRVLNAGQVGVLAEYPLHFHLNGETSRGSLHEGVVVENGKNHAFVAHGSHGITYQDCAAYNTINTPYWWDQPGPSGTTANDSDDISWLHCLSLGLVQTPGPSTDFRLTAFLIGQGKRNRCLDCVSVGVRGTGVNQSGFKWPENSVWEFDGCVAHNTEKNGIFTWTNSPERHPITNFKAYNYTRAGIEHGAYLTAFSYSNCVLQTGTKVSSGSRETFGVLQHSNARSPDLLFEDILCNDQLVVESHGLSPAAWTIHRRMTYAPNGTTKVRYRERGGSSGLEVPSRNRYEDCGLVQADFDLAVTGGDTGPWNGTEIEIWENGVLVHEWFGGSWLF